MSQVQQSDLDHWHEHGYVLVEGVLSAAEVAAARENFSRAMPDWDEYQARRPLFSSLGQHNASGAQGWVRHEFPYDGDMLNQVAVHPFLVEFAERLLGSADLALSHGAIVGKYAGRADYDQELHEDFSNNTLAYPRPEPAYSDIPMIVYYTDVTEDLGPTYVVSRQHTRDLPPRGERFYPRKEFPELYRVERPATVPAGSALIYSMRTLHRGSAMRASAGVRFSQFVAFHPVGPRWLGSHSFQGAGGRPEMDRFLSRATPRERELVGFPAVGDPYWNEEALAGVGARYPQLDLTPYR
jgi:ectoine hydroxylase-related dioxygenase (phytanoyl-CoA dioxygenase family)